MANHNTLLGRCTMVYAEAWNERIKTMGAAGHLEWPDDAQRQGTAAVLQHLASELRLLNQQNARLTMHELSRLLEQAAQGQESNQ